MTSVSKLVHFCVILTLCKRGNFEVDWLVHIMSMSTTDLNNTGSRMQWPEVKPKKMTYLEYQDGGRLVLQDVSGSCEQYQKEIITTKA